MRMTVLMAAIALASVAIGGQGRTGAFDMPEDTIVIAYDDGTAQTWWCSDRDSFGAAVRFTPAMYPCQVVGARAVVGYDEGQQVHLRVFDDNGPDGKPGTVLYEQHRPDIPPGHNVEFRDYDLTTPVTVNDGDFYICFWQKHWFHLLFATDTHFDSMPREWWYFPDWGWVTPMGMDAADQLIRARVVYPTGVQEELSSAGQGIATTVSPNPVRSGLATIHWGAGATSVPRVCVYDAGGRQVAVGASLVQCRAGTMKLDVRGLPGGVYVLKLTAPGQAATTKLVVQP